MTDDDRPSDGAEPRNELVSRRDLERAIRGLALADHETREALLQLAARVVALTDELTRRLDGIEPRPAPPSTPAPPPAGTLEDAVDAAMERALPEIRAADARDPIGVSIEPGGDKHAAPPVEIPCAELIPLCGARCCKLTFSLSTEDLDEGIVRWDYGRPYQIRQRRSDGYCVHNDPRGRGCTVHPARPRPCRVYDCRNDARIWIDFERRIPTLPEALRGRAAAAPETTFDLLERVRARSVAMRFELHALQLAPDDDGGGDP